MKKSLVFRHITFTLIILMLLNVQVFATDNLQLTYDESSTSYAMPTVSEVVYGVEDYTAFNYNINSISAAEGTVSDTVYQVRRYYKNNKTALDNWEEIVALKLAGENLKTSPWDLTSWDQDSIDSGSQATTHAGRILALLALNENPSSYGGRNFLQELTSKQQINGSFGGSINNTIWAIIALDEAGASYNKIKAIEYLISEKKSDGGFAISGTSGDPDVTGEALLALSKHRDKTGVNTTIQGAIDFLKNAQQASAGFKSWGSENAQSSARVISGLLAVEEDIIAVAWQKEGKTIIDALLDYLLPNNSFQFSSSATTNHMATRQALRALAELENAGYGNYKPGSGSGGGTPDEPQKATVRVRVEGIATSLADETVTLEGTALDALIAAVGSENVMAPGGFISTIKGEGSKIISGTITSWMYYVIRDGVYDPKAFSEMAGQYTVKTGDEIIFYMAAFDALTWESKTNIPVVHVNPAQPTSGQTLTINIAAKKFDMWTSQLVNLTPEEETAIGDYKVTLGGVEYTSQYGQVTIPNVLEGTFEYTVRNQNSNGYPNIVTYKGKIDVKKSVSSQVRVRVEGTTASLADESVTVKGTAFDALIEAVGNENVGAFGGFITTIKGESGQSQVGEGISTSWMYYVIRNGEIEEGAFSQGSNSYNVKNGDEIVFYIGALDSFWNSKTYFPIVSISPTLPTVGQPVIISINEKKYTWSGLQDLTIEEKAAIGDYIVRVGDVEYTSQGSKVTIPNVSAGTIKYTIKNKNTSGYPDVVTYKGSINVNKNSDGGGVIAPTDEIKVFVEIIGKNNQIHFSRSQVTLPQNKANAFEALKATGVSYRARDNNSYVYEIAGEKEDLTGTAGWKYKVGSFIPGTPAIDYTLNNGDSVVWFWAGDYTATGPGGGAPLVPGAVELKKEVEQSIADAVKKLEEALKNKKLVKNTPVTELEASSIVIGKDRTMTANQKKVLQSLLEENNVSIKQKVEAGKESIVTDASNEIVLKIGKDAIDREVEITATEMEKDKKTILPETHKLLSPIYEFGPKGTTFKKPVYMSIRTVIPEELNYEDILLAWYNEDKNQWIGVTTVVDASTGTVTGLVEHFTKFSLLARKSNGEKLQEEKQEDFVQFEDVTEANYPWAIKEINYLAEQGIISGVGNNRFEPAREITRAEFTTVLVKMLGLDYSTPYQGKFKDVKKEDWHAAYVQAALDAGIISGLNENSFGPSEILTREQAAVMLVKLLGEKAPTKPMDFKDASSISPWALDRVAQVTGGRIFSGFPDETFRPKQNVTRAQTAVLIYKLLREQSTIH